MKLLPGQLLPLELQLDDGATGLFPVAFVFAPDNTPVATVPLAHAALGRYHADWVMSPGVSRLSITYVVYSDSGHSTEAQYTRELDVALLDESAGSILGLVHQDSILDLCVYDDPPRQKLLLSGRIRRFPSAAAKALATVGGPDGVDGEVQRFTGTWSYDASGRLSSHGMTQVLP